MALEKQVVIDQITADQHGNLMWRVVTRIMEDGKMLSHSYHRSSLSPGACLTGVDPKVCLMARATWTPELIAPFTAEIVAKIAEQSAAKAKYEAECVACEQAKVASEAANRAPTPPVASPEPVEAPAAPPAVEEPVAVE